ncbi:agmatine deiminase family protein [Paenibacillus campinasensis]|uniref:Agmatine deiminase n=1 Tax=Paenibacillus campinasensis TaxID=66347 RepID=A0A268EVJ3_9BACL|nr:agmatine deiminase family protein [Paenibacillus campinasensis]PAD77140.1 agmatine deiminase [Paenibacillus campinasensis]
MNPSALNYRMPPEWAEHERTLISWPVQESMTFPEDYETVCNGYAEVIKAIAEFEPVTVLVDPQEVKKVSLMLGEDNIELLPLEHSDAWLRDNGPTFVKNESGELAGVNWKFNAWGEKYAPWDLDNAVPTALLKHYGVKQFDAPLILEGGSIHVDGDGTLLSTEECLLNRNRNADLSREQIEELVQAYTGTEKVIWLKRGLDGDETDGHIDNIACFAAPGKVILQVCEDPKDENYAITQENLQILEQARDARGRALEIVKLQQPPKAFYKESRLTLSYLNFYFVNGGIILPVFGGAAAETDRLAVETLQAVFPDRRIRTIDGMAIIGEGGNVHCITQQMPARS